MIRSLLLSTASATAALTLGAAPALAEDSARWFRAPLQSCERTVQAFEMQLDPGASPNLTLFYRGEDGRWIGGTFDLPEVHLAGEPILLTNAARFRTLRLEDLGTDTPRLVMMGYNAPAACDPYVLTETASPTARYAEAETLMTVENAGPADLAAARAAVADLPPAGLLPALDRQSVPQAVQDQLGALEVRVRQTVNAALRDADAPEAEARLADLRALWLDSRSRADTDQLVAAQQARVAALMLAGEDVTSLRETDPDRLCRAVMEGPPLHTLPWPATLESVSGLPLPFWSRAVAEDLIARTTACGSQRFSAIVAERWPTMEANIAAREALQVEAARLREVPPTLEAVAAANWLRPEGTASGAAGRSGTDDLAPLRDAVQAQLTEGVVVPLAEELAEGVDALPLTDLPRLCHQRMAEIDSGFSDRSFQAAYRQGLSQRLGTAAPAMPVTLPDRVVAACEDIVAATLATRGTAQLDEDRRAADAAPATLDGAIASNGFGPGRWVTDLFGSGAFAPVIADLQTQAESLRAEGQAKLDPFS